MTTTTISPPELINILLDKMLNEGWENLQARLENEALKAQVAELKDSLHAIRHRKENAEATLFEIEKIVTRVVTGDGRQATAPTRLSHIERELMSWRITPPTC